MYTSFVTSAILDHFTDFLLSHTSYRSYDYLDRHGLLDEYGFTTETAKHVGQCLLGPKSSSKSLFSCDRIELFLKVMEGKLIIEIYDHSKLVYEDIMNISDPYFFDAVENLLLKV